MSQGCHMSMQTCLYYLAKRHAPRNPSFTYRIHSRLLHRRIGLSICKDPLLSLSLCNSIAQSLRSSVDDCRQRKDRCSRLLISQSCCTHLCKRIAIGLLPNGKKMAQLLVGNRESASVVLYLSYRNIAWHRWTQSLFRNSLRHTLSMSTVAVSD
jgi:hypothetical protein